MKSDPFVVIVSTCSRHFPPAARKCLQLCLKHQGNVSFWANTCFKKKIKMWSIALIYAGGCICVLVRLLTKTLLPCTHRLQPKHFPKVQQLPGTVASILLLHLRARLPRSSVLSLSEDQQVREHTQEPFSCCYKRGPTTFLQYPKIASRGQTFPVKPCVLEVFFFGLFFFYLIATYIALSNGITVLLWVMMWIPCKRRHYIFNFVWKLLPEMQQTLPRTPVRVNISRKAWVRGHY